MITLGDITLAQQFSELRLEELEHPNRRPIVLFGEGSAALSKAVSHILTVKSSQKTPVRLIGTLGHSRR